MPFHQCPPAAFPFHDRTGLFIKVDIVLEERNAEFDFAMNNTWVDTFSLDDWLPQFSLDSREGISPSFLGPDHICLAELLRREASADCNFQTARRSDSDVFVLGYGEGPARHGTKFGGLPYLRRDVPWPRSQRMDRPLSFICQFRFDESADLVGKLPGDVLLVFYDLTGSREWHFQWCDLGIDQTDLVTAKDTYTNTHPHASAVPTCYGVRVRYSDYESDFIVEAMWRALRKRPRFRKRLKELNSGSIVEELNFIRAWACQLCVMKIGGIPYWARPIEALVEQRNHGKFLALIPPVIPPIFFRSRDKMHWINGVNLHDERSLMWPPEGCIHLYLNAGDVVEARFASLEPG